MWIGLHVGGVVKRHGVTKAPAPRARPLLRGLCAVKDVHVLAERHPVVDKLDPTDI